MAHLSSQRRSSRTVKAIQRNPGRAWRQGMTNKSHASVPQELQRYKRTSRQLRNAENGRKSLPRKEHTNWLPSIKWSALKTYTKVTLYRKCIMHLYLGIFCMNIHICTLYRFEKEPTTFKETKEEYMGGFGRRKEKGELIYQNYLQK